jgi:hypothetical protein
MVERVAVPDDRRSGGPVGTYSRQEIEDAFKVFQERAAVAGQTGNWDEWSLCFTEDAKYYEHHYGRMEGRQQILDWITATMNEPLFREMTSFPIEWYVIDEDKGWIICSVANVMQDPGDGTDHRESNWTLLEYAGNGQFSYEEDMYNPTEFGEMVSGWLKIKKAHAKK